jgi:hypothetical protein
MSFASLDAGLGMFLSLGERDIAIAKSFLEIFRRRSFLLPFFAEQYLRRIGKPFVAFDLPSRSRSVAA